MLPTIQSIHTVLANILSQVMACVANLLLKPIGYQTSTTNNKVTYPRMEALFLSLVFFLCNVALLFLFLFCDRVLDMVLVLLSSILVLNMSVFMSLVFDEQRLFSNDKKINSRFYDGKILIHPALKSLAVAKAMPTFFALIGLKFYASKRRLTFPSLLSNNFFPNKSTHLLYIDTKIAFSLLKKLYHHFLSPNGFDKVRYNC